WSEPNADTASCRRHWTGCRLRGLRAIEDRSGLELMPESQSQDGQGSAPGQGGVLSTPGYLAAVPTAAGFSTAEYRPSEEPRAGPTGPEGRFRVFCFPSTPDWSHPR